LKTVRFAIEQEKPVVFFRVETETSKPFHFDARMQKLEGGKVEHLFVKGTNGCFSMASDFLAPSQTWNWFSDEGNMRKEFGITAPTDPPVWKLLVLINIEDPHSTRRWLEFLKLLPRIKWPTLREIPFGMAALWKQTSWHGEALESEPITNRLILGSETIK
jgi:hypothetical protein